MLFQGEINKPWNVIHINHAFLSNGVLLWLSQWSLVNPTRRTRMTSNENLMNFNSTASTVGTEEKQTAQAAGPTAEQIHSQNGC